nr:small nuclear ribonucleoprotein-associated protein B [Cryptomonas paramecium]
MQITEDPLIKQNPIFLDFHLLCFFNLYSIHLYKIKFVCISQPKKNPFKILLFFRTILTFTPFAILLKIIFAILIYVLLSNNSRICLNRTFYR